MTPKEARAVELAVARLAEAMAADPRLRAELARARREFHGGDSAATALRGAADTAEHRFAEWFALERESAILGVVPIEVAPFSRVAGQLADSTAGVFLVLACTEETVQARDLQDGRVLDLAVPEGSLQQGDLLVGRLFALDGDVWTPSTAAAIFRPGQELGKAFQRDVRRLGFERRLQQIELEHLLLRRSDQSPSPTSGGVGEAPLEHLEADLDQLLQAGRSKLTAAAVSAQLELASRPGHVMGPLLEELAFETQVDLDRCRVLLLQIWGAYHDEAMGTAEVLAATPGEVPGEPLGARLARTLEEGLRHKRDVEELFAQLERMAGLEPEAGEESEDPSDGEPAADDVAEDDDAPWQEDDEDDEEEEAEAEENGGEEHEDAAPLAATGDLDALVQEYLWESGRAAESAVAPLRLWVQLQANSPLPHVDLEAVTAKDLMRLLLHVYLGAGPKQRAAAVRSTFADLQRFYAWAASTQEQDFESVLDECKGPMLEQAERLQEAGLQLSTAATANFRPGILQIEDVGPQGFGVRDDDSGNHWLTASPAALASLRVGDLLLGALAPRDPSGKSGPVLVGLVVVLPVDAKALIE